MDQGWLSDNLGRIANISLAPNGKNAMYPLFEAVMNSIQAVEERFGPDNLSSGQIEITIERDSRGDTTGFTVRDNGAGFNNANIESLRKFDSRKKAALGGKGVGRLLWLKVCDRVKIVSQFQDGASTRRVSFNFSVDSPVEGLTETDGSGPPFETSITISPYKSEYATKLPKKAETIANRVVAHFISYFTNMAPPAISLVDGTDVIDLFDAFTDKIERDADYKFKIDGMSNTTSGSWMIGWHSTRTLIPTSLSRRSRGIKHRGQIALMLHCSTSDSGLILQTPRTRLRSSSSRSLGATITRCLTIQSYKSGDMLKN